MIIHPYVNDNNEELYQLTISTPFIVIVINGLTKEDIDRLEEAIDNGYITLLNTEIKKGTTSG